MSTALKKDVEIDPKRQRSTAKMDISEKETIYKTCYHHIFVKLAQSRHEASTDAHRMPPCLFATVV